MVITAYIMVSTVDKIVENFPIPTILPIVVEPNYETITKVHFKLNANFALVQSKLGYGHLGLLYLTVSPDVYNTLSATVFIPPINHGPTSIITADATAAIISNGRQSFADATTLFKEYDSADKALKQMFLGAVDKMFVLFLRTKYVGYLNVSNGDILNHLYSEYARISTANLLNNNIALKTA